MKLFAVDRFAKEFLSVTTGYVDTNEVNQSVRGLGRIKNLNKPTVQYPTGRYLIGHVEVNQQASTPFSRTKIHKGYVACEKEDLSEGDLILDIQDNKYYLVMSIKHQALGAEVVYMDTTLYYCDVTLTIQRFEDSVRDTFGRVTNTAAVTLASGVYAMCNPQNFDTIEQPDRTLAHDKVAVYLQSTFTCTTTSDSHAVGDVLSVQEKDRLITNKGTAYIINSIDTTSLNGIYICKVDTDVR